jgi:hypothetical protein
MQPHWVYCNHDFDLVGFQTGAINDNETNSNLFVHPLDNYMKEFSYTNLAATLFRKQLHQTKHNNFALKTGKVGVPNKSMDME